MEIMFLYESWGQLIIWLSFIFIIPVRSEELLWIRLPSFDNRTSTSGYNINSRNRIHCGFTCSTDNTCVSFYFISDQELNCQLHPSILSSSDGLLSTHSSVYYVLEEALHSTTTPAPTTTTDSTTTSPPPPFSCPPDDTIFRTVMLKDGNHYTYKVVMTAASHVDAIAGCASQGSFLTRVTTVAKMNMLLQLTRTCTGYNEIGGFYVDGSNADASDFYAPGAWVMNNGDPVPMSNDFWSDGGVSMPESKHCFRMRATKNYLWDDCLCSNAYSYICEK